MIRKVWAGTRFPLTYQILVLAWSSFYLVCTKLIHLTAENKEVLSAKSFQLDLRPSDKLLMFIRKSRGPDNEL